MLAHKPDGTNPLPDHMRTYHLSSVGSKKFQEVARICIYKLGLEIYLQNSFPISQVLVS